MNMHIKDGEYTRTIYTMIKESRYNEAIKILSYQLELQPNVSQSLCTMLHLHTNNQGPVPQVDKIWDCPLVGDFAASATAYGQLCDLQPDRPDYAFSYALALYNSALYGEAVAVASQIDDPRYADDVLKLHAAVKYAEEDLQNCKVLVSQCTDSEVDKAVNTACIEYKEGKHQVAVRRFHDVINKDGYEPALVPVPDPVKRTVKVRDCPLGYALALCNYRTANYTNALKHIAELVERAMREYPELGIGSGAQQREKRGSATIRGSMGGSAHGSSQSNSKALYESALVEAVNLKAAIEYTLKSTEGALEALSVLPARNEEDLDPVTLHNEALMGMDQRPAEGFSRLQFLLAAGAQPPETFANLLLLYCKYEYYDLAADVLAENADLTYSCLTQYQYDFLDAVLTQQTSPQDAYAKFDALAGVQMEQLRRHWKKVQELKAGNNEQATKQAVAEFDEALEKYLPVLMGMAKIYWDQGDYNQVERIFKKSVEFCSEHDTWRLNVAHTLFMQETKFKEATAFYEPLVKKNYHKILDVSAVVLANLCVGYIMTNQNEEAEELMRKVEKDEDQASYDNPEKKLFHLCIINLVIGTLYCSKGNYEFGITRIIKAMEPYPKKLSTDTWFYAKRCFVSLIENMVKHTIVVRDAIINECLQFLEQCELFGQSTRSVLDGPLGDADPDAADTGRRTVTYEARQLRALLLNVLHA